MASAPPLLQLPPPPREVAWQSTGTALSVWGVRLFTLPHTLVGIGLIGVMLGAILWMLLGTTVDADITKTWTQHSRKQGTSCHVAWVYVRGGQRDTGRSSYPCDQQVSQPGVVPVRVLDLGPLHYAALWRPLRSLWELFLFPFGFGLFWNTIVGVFAWTSYVVPWQQRRILSEGRTAVGSVTRKDVVRGKTTQYKIEYSYQPMGGPAQTGKATVSSEARWKEIAEGDKVLIAYDPERPARSVAVEHCPFRVVNAAGHSFS